LIACTSHDVTDAGVVVPDATSNDATGFCAFCEAGPYEAAIPNLPDALPPPEVDCDDAGMCPLPHSVCVNADWLEYFDNGVCDDDGGCSFEVKMTNCGTDNCVDAGCYQPHITAPPTH
jgi:hypothetical protein